MINIELIDFKRVIMHEILRKTNQSDAMPSCVDSLVVLDDDVVKTLKDRLNIAFGKRTRCFEMNIANIAPNSFYDLCKDLKLQEDNVFIENSKQLAGLLAKSQNQKKIPGGYFLFYRRSKSDKSSFGIYCDKSGFTRSLTKGQGNRRYIGFERGLFITGTKIL